MPALTAVVCLGLIVLAAWAAAAVRIVHEPRRLGHGLMLVGCFVATWLWAVLLVTWILRGSELSDLVVIGPVLLVLLALIALGLYLLANTLVVVRREGLRVATLVPAVFGVMLLGVLGALVVLIRSVQFWQIGLLLTVVFIPVTMIVVALAGFTVYAMIYGRITRVGPADAVVVLGAGLSGEKVTPLLAARIDRGIDVLSGAEGPHGEPLLVMSGGKGDDETISEAEAMARYAVEAGVDPRRLVREDRSTTTEENLLNTRDRLVDRGLVDPTLVVVTNNFHVLRAASLTRGLGLDATVVGAATARYYLPAGFLREFVACLVHYRKLNLTFWAAGSALSWAALMLVWYLRTLQTEVVDVVGP